jgi:hypothetical protein
MSRERKKKENNIWTAKHIEFNIVTSAQHKYVWFKWYEEAVQISSKMFEWTGDLQ